MEEIETCTAFLGDRRVGSAPLRELLAQLWNRPPEPHATLLMFSDQTGRSMDLNLHLSLDEMLEREAILAVQEVTLLPRHWEWLESQPAYLPPCATCSMRRARPTPPPNECGSPACGPAVA